MPEVNVPLLRLVGQVASAYIVAEGPDGLYLIDQHAAHERVLFEQIMGQKGASISAQILLEPVTVELPPASRPIIGGPDTHHPAVWFPGGTLWTGKFYDPCHPGIIGWSGSGRGFEGLVEDFEEDETPLAKEIEGRIIARVCKRAAVKAGQVLSPGEQSALLRDLETCQSPRTCPHGRPTMIHLSVDLLERQFGRRGARA